MIKKIWNICVGILVIIAVICDIKMVNSLEKTYQNENYITQFDIDRQTENYNIFIQEIKKEED